MYNMRVCYPCAVKLTPITTTSNVKLAVLDLDGGIVGRALGAAAQAGPFPTVLYSNASGLGMSDMMAKVDSGGIHAALVAQPGASARLAAAVMADVSPARTCTPFGACPASRASMITL